MTNFNDNQTVTYFGMGLEDGQVQRNKKDALYEIREAVLRCPEQDVLWDGSIRSTVKYLQKHMSRPELGDRLLKALALPDRAERYRLACEYYEKVGKQVL